MLTTTHPFPKARADEALALVELFADASVSASEDPANDDLYTLTWLIKDADKDFFIKELDEKMNVKNDLKFAAVDETTDYVAANRASFPPLHVGPWFIARNDEALPADAAATTLHLSIAPNRAFGSGEHATTRGCLLAYLELTTSGQSFSNGLDVGTGSGILALAALKQQPGLSFIGTENDAPSAAIAQENAKLNGLAGRFRSVEDETLGHPIVEGHMPYDLIFANILMQPLIDLAPALGKALAVNGAAIFSGYTAEQADAVHAALTLAGLTLMTSHTEVDDRGHKWVIGVFTKNIRPVRLRG